MHSNKNEAGTLLPMIVTEGVTVNVLPNERHEYLMTVAEVATGYGATKYSIFKALQRNGAEFIEGKHTLKGVDILSTPRVRGVDNLLPPPLKGLIQPNSILLTKRGIVRLGFFIKSERAKLFRDWAEELVLAVADGVVGSALTVPVKALPRKRNHNRITSERLIRLLTLTHRIDDADLRTEIVNELAGDYDYGN